jgi:hypothetical protein
VLLDNFQFIREIAHLLDEFPYFLVELIWFVSVGIRRHDLGACPVWVRSRSTDSVSIRSIIRRRQPFNIIEAGKMTRGLAKGAGNPTGLADTGMILHRASSLSRSSANRFSYRCFINNRSTERSCKLLIIG